MTSRFELHAGAGTGDTGREAGFTLIEIIVVLAVLGFALALIVGYRLPWSSGLGVRGTAAELASGLRLARSEAISRNRPITFKIDLSDHHFQIGTSVVRPLPARLSIALLTVAGEQRGTTGDIRFNPDGSSTGGRISIADGTQRIAVGVDWLNRRVSVANVP
jgi:general secretion pathway protein H